MQTIVINNIKEIKRSLTEKVKNRLTYIVDRGGTQSWGLWTSKKKQAEKDREEGRKEQTRCQQIKAKPAREK